MVAIRTAPGVATGVPDRGPILIRVMWSLTTLSLLTAIMRVVIRARNRMFGWDDFFMIFAMACFIGWSVVLTIYAEHGGLQHIQDVVTSGPDNVALVLFLNWLSQIFGIMGVAAGKISVSALLLAIINLTDLKWQRIYLWSITIVLATLVAISCSILTFAQCTPAKALWDQRVQGRCINPKVMAGYGTFTGSFNTFADASLAIIPATIFWKLNNSATEKMQLTIVFGLNILTSVCSGIKTQYLVELSNRVDQTWATYDIFVWVTAELFLMIVCGTIPTLQPMLRFVRNTLGILQSKMSISNSRKTSTKLTSGEDAELSSLTHMRVRTMTTIERGSRSSANNDSSDQLVDGMAPPSSGVKVEMVYHVKREG